MSARGSGVGVAILDSGIEPSPDFAGRIVRFWDFTRGGIQTAPYDDYGHGTHIAGLIAGAGALSDGMYQGVAPGVSLFVFKVLDRTGRGRTSTVIRALEYITANHAHFGIHLVNLSLGHPILESNQTDPLVQAVEAAARAGLVVVVSAGNNGSNSQTGQTGYGGISSPGNAPSAITAGAANTRRTIARGDDRVASFSSRGPTWYDGDAKPDIVAPGVDLVSDAPRRGILFLKHPELRLDSHYARLSGSSMASAATTGVVALMLEANRQFSESWLLTPNAVKALLQYTATPLRSAAGLRYGALEQGAGEANGEGGLRLAATVDPSVAPGQPWTAGVTPSTRFGDDQVPWAENIVWGNYLVAGGVALYNSRAWDDNIVWGTRFDAITPDEPDGIAWATVDFSSRDDNIVWGTVADWGDNIVWGTGFLGYADDDNIVWGTSRGADNIVWGTVTEENIVWGTFARFSAHNIVWGTRVQQTASERQ
jgi:serine protease AprX